MTPQELHDARLKLDAARKSSRQFHKTWCGIMDAFCEFIDADKDAEKASAIADKYAKHICSNDSTDKDSK